MLMNMMSIKEKRSPGVEHGVHTTSSSTSSINSPKVSMFASKSGFVIPKNKLSGSLVPIFRGGKKQGGNDTESEENTKHVQRKTKWGPDLTQEASVRKGRALVYQTRVDQITALLKSGILASGYDEDSESPGAGQESSGPQNSSEKSELLELEKREAIGEILKLNPTYKAPADYIPLLKEAKVPIPVKDYPGCNFIGLIFGPSGDTQKRLEKETGAKIRVYGTKADNRKEAEIIPTDGNESHSGYEDMYVHVSAETYDKVDAAVSLIELVVTPVTVYKAAASATSDAVSVDNVNGVVLSEATPTPFTVSPGFVNPGLAQHFMRSGQAPPFGQFQPYPSQWFPTGPLSGFNSHPFPNSSAPILSNPIQVSSSHAHLSPSLFSPRPVLSAGFGAVTQNPSLAPAPSQSPHQVLQRPYPPQPGGPINPSLPPMQSSPGQQKFSTPPPFTNNTLTLSGSNQNVRFSVSPRPPSVPFLFPDRPLTSTGWSQSPVISPASLGSSHAQQILQPMVHPQSPLPVSSLSSAVSGGTPLNTIPSNIPFWPSTSQSSSVTQVQPAGQQPFIPNQTPNPMAGSLQMPSSLTSRSMPPPQSGMPVTPPSVTALRPPLPSSNNFTFQPHRSQNQVIPGPGSQSIPHIMPPQNLTLQSPQSPSFRPGMTSPAALPGMQGFLRPQLGHQMGQPQAQFTMHAPSSTHQAFRGPALGPVASTNPVLPMERRHFNPVPQGINPPGPFPSRPQNPAQLQQNYPAIGNRHQNLLAPANQQFSGNVSFPAGGPASRPSGLQQIYDPFSPTSVPLRPQFGGNPPTPIKQESDPEYEDLMASVGVK